MRAVILICVLLANTSASAASVSLPRSDGERTPVMVYEPQTRVACPPTVILSHGLGGSEQGLNTYGAALSARGYRVLVMGHGESGLASVRRAVQEHGLRTGLAQTANRPMHEARSLDLDAAYAHAVRDCRPPLLVLGGHSMGAATTMIEAGARARFGSLGKDRFDAYVAISPQGESALFPPGAWQAIRKPVLMITGTDDRTLAGRGYEDRLSAFEGLQGKGKRLAILQGANHRGLGGRGDARVSATVVDLMSEFLSQARVGRFATSKVPGVTTHDR